jgi:hypothetical protein
VLRSRILRASAYSTLIGYAISLLLCIFFHHRGALPHPFIGLC